MTRLVLSLDGKVLEEIVLTKPRTTIGRRVHNDIVIDHLGVSGEHAALVQSREGLCLEDLRSTNGTYVNDQPVERRLLLPGDVIGISRFRLLVAGGEPGARLRDGTGQEFAAAGEEVDPAGEAITGRAVVRVLDGPAAGREVLLTKERTTLGKPGMLVVAIERRGDTHLLSQVEGGVRAMVNGTPLPTAGSPLQDGDLIDLMGTRLKFSRR